MQIAPFPVGNLLRYGALSNCAKLLGKFHGEMKVRAAAQFDFRVGEMKHSALQRKEREGHHRVAANGEKSQMLAHAIGKRRGGSYTVNYAVAIHTLAGVIDPRQLRVDGISAAVR